MVIRAHGQRNFFSGLLFILVVFTLSGCTILNSPQISVPHGVNTPQANAEIIEQINSALQENIHGREDVLAFLIYDVTIDHVDLSPDENTALIWINLVDRETAQILPAETGLAIARRFENNAPWQIYLQADSGWTEQLTQIPETMLSLQDKSKYMPNQQDIPHDHQVYSGYRLPWQPGLSKTVTGSIGHVLVYKTCPSTCMYAFDFADGTNFAILAAKAGTVKYVQWAYPNGNTKHANYIILEDTTTTPTTYQVYFHLAQDSIPPALRVIGAQVLQGQYIGNVDDTGLSSGSHLHFHVHTNATSYWGNSVDITFDDVTINGGRPRTCSEARMFPEYGSQCQEGNKFISGNGDNRAPTGNFTNITNGQTLSQRVLHVEGVANDDTGLLKIEIFANYSGQWVKIGQPQPNQVFSADLNLCENDIPDGIFLISLMITDQAGKSSEYIGTTDLIKNFSCYPTPTSTVTPTATQTQTPEPTSTFTPSPSSTHTPTASQTSIPDTATPDTSGMMSELEALPILTEGTAILLKWQYSENFERIAGFEIQYSVENSDWILWNKTIPADSRQAWFIGEAGKEYKFRIRSYDATGNFESWSDTIEAQTIIETQCTLDFYDENTSDNDQELAIPLELDEEQEHNFCPEEDEDWLSFTAQENTVYQLNISSENPIPPVIVQIYPSSSSIASQNYLLDQEFKTDPIKWTCPQSGEYFLRILPVIKEVSGTRMAYTVSIIQIRQIFTPGIIISVLLLPLFLGVIKIKSLVRAWFK